MRRSSQAALLAVAALVPRSARAEPPSRSDCPPQRFERAAECPPPPTVAGYDPDQGAFLRTADGRWLLNPYGMVQLQNVNVWSAGETRQTTFDLHAAKLILHGHVYDRSLTYHFQINAGAGKVVAEDIYLRWDPLASLGLFFGQIETPFNRQHITLEAYQELVDRSTVDTRFSLRRDIGAAVQLSDKAHVFEWTSGVWNGSGQNATNEAASYLLTTRLAWNPNGPIAFREADLENSRVPKFSGAWAGAYDPKRIAPAASGSGTTTTRELAQQVVEGTLRWRGLSLTTEGHARRQTLEGQKLRIDYGTFLQAGFFVIPRHVEIVGRLGEIAGDLAPGDPQEERTVGASFYAQGHRLKVQADTSSIVLERAPAELRARFQVEFFL